jgi:hypothetical protein
MLPASWRLLGDLEVEVLDLWSVHHDDPGLLRVGGSR